MNLQERKAKLESIVAQHRQELDKLAAYREKLISELNAFYGQLQLLDELLAEEVELEITEGDQLVETPEE